jgi:outer membrane protein OmpA-like peptidoglycan-associated protein
LSSTHGHTPATPLPAEPDPLWWLKGLFVAAATVLFIWAILKVDAPGVGRVPPAPVAYQPPRAGRHAAPAEAGHGMPAEGALGLGALVHRELPGGARVQVPERGVEGALLAFLDDAARAVDKETWFDFDRLTFATGSATLAPSSGAQLEAVAEILGAYPRAKLKIGGYTDNVGDPALNQKLSEERAASVRAQLVGLGVAPERLGAEGYGERFPVGDNATAEGRARNRRISMRVTEK